MKPAIEIKSVSKVYTIGHEQKPAIGTITARDALINLAKKPIEIFTGHRLQREKFWALDDISFDVEQGDVLGIIGRNGSGKSTLLKILSRIVEPTAGEIRMRGKVASLLEVGTGFHPELSGRENVYFNGAILGMTQKEIRSKFNEIVEFSEVEQFLDTPVKFYSSGMYVRLAFAVAAHLDPEILIVDEVLAVGDAAFQKKCLGKMKAVAGQGRTVLFVSHNMSAVQSLCKKAVFLDKGVMKSFGSTTSVIEDYARESMTGQTSLEYENEVNKKAKILKVEIIGSSKNSARSDLSEPLIVSVRYQINEPMSSAVVTCDFYTADGTPLMASLDTDGDISLYGKIRDKGIYEATITIPPNTFSDKGFYFVTTIQSPGIEIFDTTSELYFEIYATDSYPRNQLVTGGHFGLISPILTWEVKKIH